jgi:competence protein ComEC
MADISLGEQGLEATHARRNPLHRLADALAAEGDRRILWLPVFFGSGIALYFALTVEPPVWLGPAMALAGGLAAFAFRGHFARRSACLCLAIAAAGFALIAETTRERAAPMLERRLGPASR